MTDADVIEIVTARMEGKQIQLQLRPEFCREPDVWHDIDSDSAWNFAAYLYRVKPEE